MAELVVVDASVWVAYFIQHDVHHVACKTWLQNHALNRGTFAVPVLLLAELAGAVYRRSGKSELAKAALAEVLKLPELTIVPIDRTLGNLAADLAAQLGWRGADATYAALAYHLNVSLLSLDQEHQTRAGYLIKVRNP